MSISIHPLSINHLSLPLVVTGIGTQEEQCSIIRENGYPTHQIIFQWKAAESL